MNNGGSRAYYRAMTEPDQRELQRRLESLAPFFQDLGARILESYAAAGILSAMPDGAFPVADALFTRKAGDLAYHPRGPVYFSITRTGKLELGVAGQGTPLPAALHAYVQMVSHQDLKEAGRPDDGATEWFPPPRFLLDKDTSRLFIESVDRTGRHPFWTVFMPVEQYLDERSDLFIQAFRNAP